jgi:hypothetical protein
MSEYSINDNFTQLDISPKLDESRRASIRKALEKYQAECLKQNLRTLEIHMQTMRDEGDQEIEDGNYTAEEVQRAIKKTFTNSIMRYEDVKILIAPEESAVKSEMIKTFEMDGVSHDPVDLEMRKKWWDSIWAAIVNFKDDIPAEQFPPGLPDDLQYLSTLVNAVLSPGLDDWRETQHRDFIPPVDEHDLSQVGYGMVSVPCLGNWMDESRGFSDEDSNDYNNYFGGQWCKDGWDIAVGVSTSCWPSEFGGRSFMIYCRPQEEGGQWGWRYGYDDAKFDGRSKIFDSVEEYLGWYARYREQTPENIQTPMLEFD